MIIIGVSNYQQLVYSREVDSVLWSNKMRYAKKHCGVSKIYVADGDGLLHFLPVRNIGLSLWFLLLSPIQNKCRGFELRLVQNYNTYYGSEGVLFISSDCFSFVSKIVHDQSLLGFLPVIRLDGG